VDSLAKKKTKTNQQTHQQAKADIDTPKELKADMKPQIPKN
jgi:hypothetical protein